MVDSGQEKLRPKRIRKIVYKKKVDKQHYQTIAKKTKVIRVPTSWNDRSKYGKALKTKGTREGKTRAWKSN